MRQQRTSKTPTASDAPFPHFGTTRKGFWLLLIVTLLIAFALPLLSLWHASSSALHARACIWPATPRANASAQLLVVLSDKADHAAVQGTWAQVSAEWDMTNMEMGPDQRTVHGPPHALGNIGAFEVPLRLDMAGPWSVHVTLRTPGRPAWQAVLQFSVLSPAISTPSAGESLTLPYSDPCGATTSSSATNHSSTQGNSS